MALEEKIQGEFRAAMKARDTLRVETLKMLRAAIIKERTREGRGGKDKPLEEAEILGLIRKEMKSRKDSVEAFRNAGRTELAEKEAKEIEILSVYLPAEMSDEELAALVEKVASEIGAGTTAAAGDRGKLIRETISRAAGRVDGKRASGAVAAFLSR